MKTATALLLTLLSSTLYAATEERSNWQDVYPVSTATPYLTISNIWGGVTVRCGTPSTREMR